MLDTVWSLVCDQKWCIWYDLWNLEGDNLFYIWHKSWRMTKNILMVKTWWVLIKSCLRYDIVFFLEFIEHCIEFGEWPKKQYMVWNFKNDPNRRNVAWNWYLTKNPAIFQIYPYWSDTKVTVPHLLRMGAIFLMCMIDRYKL